MRQEDEMEEGVMAEVYGLNGHGPALSPVPSEPLLGCPFCGATPEKMGNTTSVWVPHTWDCFLRPVALSELGQVRWNTRQPNSAISVTHHEEAP